jgi:DNA-binding MarR family transcriptional regulator
MTTQRSASGEAKSHPGKYPREVFTVLDALRGINQTLRRFERLAEQRLGISGAQLLVLQELASAPAQSLGELAERTFTHHSSVSVVVSRLAEAGLVVREPSPEDTRRAVIQLTARGRQLVRRAPVAPQAELILKVSRLPRATLAALAEALGALDRSLSSAPAPRHGARVVHAARRSPAKRRKHVALRAPDA